MAGPLTIMTFSWNAAGLRLCETLSQNKADMARVGFKAKITFKQSCLAPNFFEDIRTEIRNRAPHLVVITTQDEDSSDTYFHSDVIPEVLSEIGYTMIKRDKQEGITDSTIGRPVTGTPSGGAIRMSIYARDGQAMFFTHQEQSLDKFFGNNGQTNMVIKQGSRIVGAIASYINHDVFGRFVFIAAHLPSGADDLQINKNMPYESYRAAMRASNSLCFISMLHKFVDSVSPEMRPEHVFILGDLNYDIIIPGKSSVQVISELSNNLSQESIRNVAQYDELKKALLEPPLLGFKEGINGGGPTFMPTWKLARNRPDSCAPSTGSKVDITCFDSGVVGWHDRIIYSDKTTQFVTTCQYYNRLDVNNMHASTHAGILALFNVKSAI